MPTVYVVQENPNLNYSSAEAWSEVQFLTCREYSPSKNSLRNKELLGEINTRFKDFDPDQDFLLLSGNPITMGYVFALALQKKGYLNVLWYQKSTNEYQQVPFNPATILSMAG